MEEGDFVEDTENEPLGSADHVFKEGVLGGLMWVVIIGIVLYFIVSWISKMF